MGEVNDDGYSDRECQWVLGYSLVSLCLLCVVNGFSLAFGGILVVVGGSRCSPMASQDLIVGGFVRKRDTHDHVVSGHEKPWRSSSCEV